MYKALPASILTLFNKMDYDKISELSHKVRICRKVIEETNKQYEKGTPIVSDHEWYLLLNYVNALEDKLGVELTSDCSIVPVDATTLKPMHSLNKVYDVDKLIEFLNKFEQTDRVVVEPKLDGVSLVVCYRNSVFSHLQLKNRTFNLEQALKLPIKDINKIVNETTPVASVDVRGEVVIELDKFDNYVDSFSNARTIVSSMLNTKDASKLGYPSDLFDFIVFETIPSIEPPSTFEKVDSCEYSVTATIDLINEDLMSNMYSEAIPYLLDGLVFKVPAYEHLGYTKRFPRHHMALKYLSEQSISKIVQIHIDETEKGIRQSVRLSIEPTSVDGTLVRSINMGSVKSLELFDLHEGDYVKFILSGGIVPVVIEKLS